ncbi:hypothetical protein [Micromonospora maritima]|uniref:hypothetical protein n=1 Tax=Micromonospora maritima TaxID=986711 RepID=UPI00157DB3E2|nr:hypothetical protein [Micromonospora maritima]
MSDDVLGHIDAAVEATREELCACGCGRHLFPGDPSPYFAGPDCQTSWHLQQQAIAEGEPERAEEMRRQRAENPIERLRRRVAELSPRRREREEGEERRARIVEWLRANGIDPMRVAEGYPIITTPTSITVHDYTRDEDDQVCLVDGEVATVEEMYPLRVAWPAGLDYEHHRFELDEDESDADRRLGEVFASVGGATRMLGNGQRLDATALTYDHPFLYRIRCTGCGRRGTPINAEGRLMADGSVQSRWTCDCGTHVSSADVTATVERFAELDGLHLRLGYGREMVHYALPERQLDRHDSLDAIWREMEALLATSVRLPWSDSRSNPLADVREFAERARSAGHGTVWVAPLGTSAGEVGWREVGTTDGDGFEWPAEPAGYHRSARAVDLPVRFDFDSFQRAVAAARAAMAQLRIPVQHLVQPLAALGRRTDNPMLRAIEAKKNRTHGPQREKRAPQRIDPRRSR